MLKHGHPNSLSDDRDSCSGIQFHGQWLAFHLEWYLDKVWVCFLELVQPKFLRSRFICIPLFFSDHICALFLMRFLVSWVALRLDFGF